MYAIRCDCDSLLYYKYKCEFGVLFWYFSGLFYFHFVLLFKSALRANIPLCVQVINPKIFSLCDDGDNNFVDLIHLLMCVSVFVYTTNTVISCLLDSLSNHNGCVFNNLQIEWFINFKKNEVYFNDLIYLVHINSLTRSNYFSYV